MNKRRSMVVTITICTLLIFVLISSTALAQSSPSSVTVPYTGHLTDPAGQPVADGQYDFVFTLYASEKDDQAVWSETQLGVSVKGGDVRTSLGALAPFPAIVSNKGTYWLAVSVRGPGEAKFTLLNPRQRWSAIPVTPDSVTALTCPHSHFTDNWTGTNSELGLLLDNSGTGDGLRAYSRSTAWNYAAVFGANIATTGNGTGVYGYSDKGAGVYANSASGDGLEATTTSATRSGVYAHSGPGYGVTGRSTGNFGVQAGGGGDGDAYDLVGDLLLEGNRGELFTGGTVLNLFSNGWIAFDLDNDNNGSHRLEVWNGTDSLVFSVDESGNTFATGTKSASVQTADYGQRLLYAVESPEVWFEDFGSAKLVNGTTTVKFETVFAQTANLTEDYHVFLTPLGDCALYVAEKTPASFTVKAMGGQTCSVAFDYRIVAKRLGYEQTRLAPDSGLNSRSPEAQP